MTPRRVLHVLATAQEQGTSICRMVRTLARTVDPQRYRIEAWFLGGDGPLAEELGAAGLPVRTFKWTGDRGDVAGGWWFWRSLRREDFSVVHLNFGGRTIPLLVRLALRTKIVRHLHDTGAEAGRPGALVVPPWAADAVVAVSRAVARLVMTGRPWVVHYGVQVPDRRWDFQTVAERRHPVVGVASRLVPIKGIVYLIRAVASLQREFPDLHVEIAGTGPEQGSLREEARAGGVEDRVTFLGWQSNLWGRFAQWDIVAQPSLDEGLPMTVLEAMAAGLPVVGTSAGGLPELIDDGCTGYVVPPGDVTALAGRLRDLLSSADRRRAMGGAARARVRERFSAERMAADLTSVYDELLNPGGGRA